MQYRDAYAFFVFLVFIMVIFNYKDYTERLQKQKVKIETKTISPILMKMSRVKSTNRTFSMAQNNNIASCVSQMGSGTLDSSKNPNQKYGFLNGESFVVYVGLENQPVDEIFNFFLTYNPRKYIVLEPTPNRFLQLKAKMSDNPKVVLLNFGLSSNDDIMAYPPSSVTTQNGKQRQVIHLVKTEDFFIQLGVGFFQVDLLVLDCGQFQRKILAQILSSSLINEFRHIQICLSLDEIRQSEGARLHCQQQELLKETHSLSLASPKQVLWTRKDIK